MTNTNVNHKPFWKDARIIFILSLSIIGIGIGFCGFHCQGSDGISDSFYKTFQFFILHSTEHNVELLINISRWLIFAVFLFVSGSLIFTIVLPEQLTFLKIKLRYCNHIIICGLAEQSLQIADKYSNEQLVFIDNKANNPLHRSLRNPKAKLIIGDPNSADILKIAKIHKAKDVFVFTDNDKKNVEIAQTAFSVVENENRKQSLRCFVLIADHELKTLLEETTLFKYKTKNFDGILFNANEIGIKYGICMHIDKILPAKMKTSPEILIVGLTEKAENVIFNLAHCLTMQRETVRFTIVEKDETIVNSFRKKYHYLWGFVEINFAEEIENICTEKTFDSILICTESQTEAIKQAVAIRYILGVNTPNILVFCDEADTFNKVLNKAGKLNEKGEKEVFPLKDKTIFLINLFEETADYVFVLDKFIEEKARMTHRFWNKLYGDNKEYDEMSGHFRQSNRNQILDNFLRVFIALGKSFHAAQDCLVSFTDNDKETLAIMEHRRWMIEKYENGWQLGERVKPDEFKRHDCLIMWDELPEHQKKKDFDAIDLMIHLLNNQRNDN